MLTTHLPVLSGRSDGGAARSLATPWFQLSGGSSGGTSSSSEGYPPFRYSATLLSSSSSSSGGTQQRQQRGGQAPPAIQQQQQQQQAPEPQVTYFFCSFDGGCSARSVARGFRCPLASCRGLRCHSYAALQQHIGSMHGYHSSYFSGLMPDGGLEVYLRCKPGALLLGFGGGSAWSVMLCLRPYAGASCPARMHRVRPSLLYSHLAVCPPPLHPPPRSLDDSQA